MVRRPLTDTDDLKERRAARAFELLKLAVERGFKDVEHMKKDADLDTLRQRDDFKKLLEELGKKEKSEPQGPPR